MRYALGIAGILLVCGAAWFSVRVYRAADHLIIAPAITQRLATEAAGEGWELTHANYYRENYHRYIFHHGDLSRDVEVNRNADGKWSAEAGPAHERNTR